MKYRRFLEDGLKKQVVVCVGLLMLMLVVRRQHSFPMQTSASLLSTKTSEAEIIAGLRNQIATLQKFRIAYGELYCQQHGIGPTGGFCVESVDEDVGGNRAWDQPVCSVMASVFAGKTVLDLGCGLGWYGKCLGKANKDIKWTGLDGSEGIEKATSGHVKFIDLTIPLYLEEAYDWVVSLEVGEHIPHEYEEVLLGNIVRHAKEGIVLSWAVEGQGGHYHVNNHNNDYVIARMLERGFQYDSELSSTFRERAELSWFKDTIMVFRRLV